MRAVKSVLHPRNSRIGMNGKYFGAPNYYRNTRLKMLSRQCGWFFPIRKIGIELPFKLAVYSAEVNSLQKYDRADLESRPDCEAANLVRKFFYSLQ